MTKYERCIFELKWTGTTKMKCFGNSMTPILKSGVVLTFRKCDKYEVGDIVFCKVKGRIIGAHKIIKIDEKGRYLIANNHGRENGWTKTIYGKAIEKDGEAL